MANIKFSNSVKLDYSSINGIGGIDVSNIIASNQYDYTPTVDGFLQLNGGTNTGIAQALVIGNVQVWSDSSGYIAAADHEGAIFYPVKKGQRCYVTTGSGTASNVARFRFFGVKY